MMYREFEPKWWHRFMRSVDQPSMRQFTFWQSLWYHIRIPYWKTLHRFVKMGWIDHEPGTYVRLKDFKPYKWLRGK